MNRKALMKKVLARISRFELSEETIFHVIELSDRRKNYPDGGMERGDAYGDLRGFLSVLTDRELQELTRLMDFGRNLSYVGFLCEVAEGFIENVDSGRFSHMNLSSRV